MKLTHYCNINIFRSIDISVKSNVEKTQLWKPIVGCGLPIYLKITFNIVIILG